MKKINILINTTLILIFLCNCTKGSLFAQSYSGGSGTVGDPYHIANKSDLKYLSENLSEWYKNFIQTADIYFTVTDFSVGGNFYNGGSGFIPIGNGTTQFIGSYNGQEHIIDSLYINQTSNDFIGFFGFISNATVSNIGLTNLQVSGYENVGGLIGFLNYSVAINCYTTGNINGTNYTGGLAGTNYNSTINNSYSMGNVGGYQYIGGLIGGNRVSTINNNYFIGNVNGSGDRIGGLVGENWYSNIINCNTTATVVIGNNNVGGLAGTNENCTISDSYSLANVSGNVSIGGLVGTNSVSCTISTSYATGNASGNSYIGGLVGNNASNINNSYSTGSANGSNFIGGLVGYNSDNISNSYSIGSVTGTTNFGGLVGFNNSSVSNCFWDTQTSSQPTSAGGTGLFTSQMQTQSTFTNATWDFVIETTNGTNDYWKMPCLGGYPLFRWQTDPSTTFSSMIDSSFCNYTWSQNGMNYTSSGSYNDTLQNAVGCDSIITLNLIINSIDTSVTNTTPTLIANATGSTYQWLDCNNNFAIITGETNQSFTATTNGSYAVEITQNGCSDTSACYTIVGTEIIENNFDHELILYPNPTSGNFSINLGSNYSYVNISITDIIGKIIQTNYFNKGQTFNMSLDLPSGIYLLKVQTGSKLAVIRVVKE